MGDIVEFKKAPKKVPKVSEIETEDLTLEEIVAKNKANKERIAKDRDKANQKVKRDYRLKD